MILQCWRIQCNAVVPCRTHEALAPAPTIESKSKMSSQPLARRTAPHILQMRTGVLRPVFEQLLLCRCLCKPPVPSSRACITCALVYCASTNRCGALNNRRPAVLRIVCQAKLLLWQHTHVVCCINQPQLCSSEQSVPNCAARSRCCAYKLCAGSEARANCTPLRQ